jgi:hypothetical protein
MGKIDVDNYEAFLLDYVEGNLGEADIRELRNFALLHPELNIDLEKEELPSVFAEDDAADFKKDLLRSENDIPGYELIAYIEGTLSGEERKKLEKELAADPDLARELEMYRKTILNKESFVFEHKATLEKTEDEFLLSNRAIQYIEGTLSAKEKSIFENDLGSGKSLQQEVQLLEKTVLAPDLSVIYPDKSELKKKARVIGLFSYRSAAAVAAAVLLLIGLIVLLSKNNSNEKVEHGLAENGKPKNNISVPSVKDSTVPAIKNNAVPPVNENTVPAVVNARQEAIKNPSLLANKINVEEKKQRVKDTVKAIEDNKQLVRKEEEKKQLPEVVFPEKISSDSALAAVKKENQNVGDASSAGKMLTMIPVEEDDDEAYSKPEKKGFWKRAVDIARQANVLGLKAVNGEEKGKGDYMLSFAGFSVEKK